jgi:hypothetical protein
MIFGEIKDHGDLVRSGLLGETRGKGLVVSGMNREVGNHCFPL